MVIRLYGARYLSHECLVELAGFIEHIDVPSHGAVGLMSGSRVWREECGRNLMKEILSKDFLRLFEATGIVFTSRQSTTEELPEVRFNATRDGERLLKIIVSGWSGTMTLNGALHHDSFESVSQLQSIMRERLSQRHA